MKKHPFEDKRRNESARQFSSYPALAEEAVDLYLDLLIGRN